MPAHVVRAWRAVYNPSATTREGACPSTKGHMGRTSYAKLAYDIESRKKMPLLGYRGECYVTEVLPATTVQMSSFRATSADRLRTCPALD